MAIVLHGEAVENSIIQTVLNLRQKLISGVAKLLTKILELDDFTRITKESELLNKISSGITGINKKKLGELMSSADALKASGDIIIKNTQLVKKAFGLNDGENIVFANGRVSYSLIKYMRWIDLIGIIHNFVISLSIFLLFFIQILS